MLLDYIYFNGKNSLDFDVFILNPRTYYGSNPDFNFVSVPGRSGDLLVNNKRFVNYEDTYLIGFEFGRYDDEKIRNIRNWLHGSQSYQKLIDSKFPNYYRWAVCTNALNIDGQLADFGQANVVFNCKPYRYRLDGEKVISITDPRAIYNFESIPSNPYIKIYGSGNITVNINDQSIILQSVIDYIEIDSEMKDCFKDKASQNDKLKSDWPIFEPGTNYISWSGTVSKIEIVPRWVSL